MIALNIRTSIDPAKAAAFEAEFIKLAAYVRDAEPGTLVYHLCIDRAVPGRYEIMEVYRDEDAMKAHVSSDIFLAFKPLMADAVTAPPDVSRLEVVA